MNSGNGSWSLLDGSVHYQFCLEKLWGCLSMTQLGQLEADWWRYIEESFLIQSEKWCFALILEGGKSPALMIYCFVKSYSKTWWFKQFHAILSGLCGSEMQTRLSWEIFLCHVNWLEYLMRSDGGWYWNMQNAFAHMCGTLTGTATNGCCFVHMAFSNA